MQAHPFTNFQIQKYYQNEHKFKGLYSRNYLTIIKDKVYVISINHLKLIGLICM